MGIKPLREEAFRKTFDYEELFKNRTVLIEFSSSPKLIVLEENKSRQTHFNGV